MDPNNTVMGYAAGFPETQFLAKEVSDLYCINGSRQKDGKPIFGYSSAIVACVVIERALRLPSPQERALGLQPPQDDRMTLSTTTLIV